MSLAIVDVLLAMILALLGILGFMGQRYFERVERQIQGVNDLRTATQGHSLAIDALWRTVFREPMPPIYLTQRGEEEDPRR